MLRRSGFLVLTVLAAAWFTPAVAQESVEQQLTGGASREWVFRRIVRSMGVADACTSGLTYTFEAAGQALVVRDCNNGVLTTTRHAWRLVPAGPGDTALVVDGLGTYVLLFRDAADGSRFMRLRRTGRDPTEPTDDREFRLSED